MEEHGWRNGHEKRPNENYGRDSAPRNVDEKYRFFKERSLRLRGIRVAVRNAVNPCVTSARIAGFH